MDGLAGLLILLFMFLFFYALASLFFKAILGEKGIIGILLSVLFLGFLFGSDDDIDDC